MLLLKAVNNIRCLIITYFQPIFLTVNVTYRPTAQKKLTTAYNGNVHTSSVHVCVWLNT